MRKTEMMNFELLAAVRRSNVAGTPMTEVRIPRPHCERPQTSWIRARGFLSAYGLRRRRNDLELAELSGGIFARRQHRPYLLAVMAGPIAFESIAF
jgi:hypothetical protein